jgi:hypothetical protein
MAPSGFDLLLRQPLEDDDGGFPNDLLRDTGVEEEHASHFGSRHGELGPSTKGGQDDGKPPFIGRFFRHGILLFGGMGP